MGQIQHKWWAEDRDVSGRKALRRKPVRDLLEVFAGLFFALIGVAWVLLLAAIPLLIITFLLLGVYFFWTHI